MKEPIIISVGGGKGGVGKSIVAANVGTVLASKGLKVGFIDGDLRGANLHLCLGVRRPSCGLQDFLSGRSATLESVALETVVPGTWLISGASDILNLANPKYSQQQKIITHLKRMSADYILVDLGAGTDAQVCDFFAAFTYGIVVCDGLPTSVENAYGFLKNGVMRGFLRLFPGNAELQQEIRRLSDPRSASGAATVDEMLASLQKQFPEEAGHLRTWLHRRKAFLVLNMVKEREDVAVGNRFVEMVKRYLSVDLLYIGYVLFSSDMRAAARTLRPIVMGEQHPKLKACFDSIAQNLRNLTKG